MLRYAPQLPGRNGSTRSSPGATLVHSPTAPICGPRGRPRAAARCSTSTAPTCWWTARWQWSSRARARGWKCAPLRRRRLKRRGSRTPGPPGRRWQGNRRATRWNWAGRASTARTSASTVCTDFSCGCAVPADAGRATPAGLSALRLHLYFENGIMSIPRLFGRRATPSASGFATRRACARPVEVDLPLPDLGRRQIAQRTLRPRDFRGNEACGPWTRRGCSAATLSLFRIDRGGPCPILAAAAGGAAAPAVRAAHPRLSFRPAADRGFGRSVEQVRELYRRDAAFRGIFDTAAVRPRRSSTRDPAAAAAAWVVSGEDRFANAAADAAIGRANQPNRAMGRYSQRVVLRARLGLAVRASRTRWRNRARRRAARIAERLETELAWLDDGWHGALARAQPGGQRRDGRGAGAGRPARPASATCARAAAHYVEALRALEFSEGWPEGPSYWIYNRAAPYAVAADCFLTAIGTDDDRRDSASATSCARSGSGPSTSSRQTASSSLTAIRPVRCGWERPGWWELTADYFARLSRDPGVVAGARLLPQPLAGALRQASAALVCGAVLRPVGAPGARLRPGRARTLDAQAPAAGDAVRPAVDGGGVLPRRVGRPRRDSTPRSKPATCWRTTTITTPGTSASSAAACWRRRPASTATPAATPARTGWATPSRPSPPTAC